MELALVGRALIKNSGARRASGPGCWLIICAAVVAFGLANQAWAKSASEPADGSADGNRTVGMQELAERQLEARSVLAPAQRIIALISSYHRLQREESIQASHEKLAEAFALNAQVEDRYLRGRNYFGFFLIDSADRDRDKIIDSLKAADLLNIPGIADYWDHQWDSLRTKYTPEWLSQATLETLNPLRPGDRFALGQLVDKFVGANKDLTSAGSEQEDIFANAERANYVVLMERGLLHAYIQMLSIELKIEQKPFDSIPSALKAMFPVMTSFGQFQMAKASDFYAEQALDREQFESAGALYRLCSALIHSARGSFPSKDYLLAKTQLQQGYISLATGQPSAAEMFLKHGGESIANIPDENNRLEMQGFHSRYEGQRLLQVQRKDEAEQQFRKAARAFSQIGHPNALGSWADVVQALVFADKPDAALAAAEEGLKLSETLAARFPKGHKASLMVQEEQAQLHRARAMAFHDKDAWDSEMVETERALSLTRQPMLRAALLLQQARLNKRQRHNKHLLKALFEADRLMSKNRENELGLHVALEIGLAYDDQGNSELALPYLERALSIHTFLRKRGRMNEAYASLLFPPYLNDLETRLVKVAFELLQKTPSGPERDKRAQALLYLAEQFKARRITDDIESVRRGAAIYIAPGVREELSALPPKERQELNSLFGFGDVIQARSLDATSTFKRYRELASTLTTRHGKPALLVEYTPITARDKVVLFVIDSGHASWMNLDTSWRKMEELVSEYRRLVVRCLEAYSQLSASPVRDKAAVSTIQKLESRLDDASAALGRALFPAQLVPGFSQTLPELMAGRSLVIFPHGRLHNVPYAAIRVPKLDGQPFVVDVVERMSSAPSFETLSAILTLYTENLEQPLSNVLLVGNESDPGLAAVKEEFAGIRSIFPDSTRAVSTVESFRQAYRNSSAIHFSVHGKLDIGEPLQSSLSLTDGDLRLTDILGLTTFRTRFVALAACEAGQAEVADLGDEVLSLAVGFISAGVPAVLGALWDLDGATAATFYSEFYRAVAGGSDPGLALRRTMRTVRDSSVRANPRDILHRGNPSFWAGFHLLGE